MLNRSGLKASPWGTPLNASNGGDEEPLDLTQNFRFSRKLKINLAKDGGIPIFCSLRQRSDLSTRSKAFL